MKRLLYILMFAHALLLASCGQQHDAETIVNDFLKANLADPSSLSGVQFAAIDSTGHVNDSIVEAMRSNAAATGIFKQGIAYAERSGNAKAKLITSRTEYTIGTRQFAATFYIDAASKGVVAFKCYEKAQ